MAKTCCTPHPRAREFFRLIGIGFGSLAAGYLSSGKVEYGLIPLGSVGMTVLGILLSARSLSFTHVLILLAVLGFSAGFFAVPVNALIQHRPDEKTRVE